MSEYKPLQLHHPDLKTQVDLIKVLNKRYPNVDWRIWRGRALSLIHAARKVGLLIPLDRRCRPMGKIEPWHEYTHRLLDTLTPKE